MRRAWLLLTILISAGCQNNSAEIAFGSTEYDLVRLTASANEIITAIPVHEGQWVTAGTLLIQQDTHRAEQQLTLAAAQLQEASAALEELTQGSRQQSIAAAQAQVQEAAARAHNAAAQAARGRTLQRANMLSQSDLDALTTEQARSQAQLEVAQQTLDLIKAGNRSEQLAQGRARVAAAAAALELQRQRLAELSITAPSDGQIDELPYRVGERVAPGALLGTLLQGAQAYGRLYIPAQQRAKLAVGDTLNLQISGLQAPLKGTIRSIAQEPAFTPYFALNQKERARLVYLTEVTLPATDTKLPAGLPVQWVQP